MIKEPFIYKFCKDLTNDRENTKRVVVFSRTPFPNILKYRDGRWDHATFWKTTFLQTHIEEFS